MLNYCQPRQHTTGKSVIALLDTGAVLLSHTFTAANSDTTIPSADTGQATEALDGVWGIASNQAKVATGVTTNYGAVVWDAGISDSSGQVTFATVDSGDTRVVFRAVDENNLIFYNANGALFKIVTGTLTQIGDGDTIASGDTVGWEVSASGIVILKNSVQSASATDSAHQTATKYGIGSGVVSTSRWDNLIVRAA